jgi:hypothetical protein
VARTAPGTNETAVAAVASKWRPTAGIGGTAARVGTVGPAFISEASPVTSS